MRCKLLLCILMMLLMNVLIFAKSEVDSIEQKSNNIIEEIRSKYQGIYNKYKGIRFRQHTNIEEIDIKTGKIIGTKEITMLREEYFYKKPIVKVEKYIVDGKIEKNNKCKIVIKDPIIPVLDRNGEKNYILENSGVTVIDGDTLIKVKVSPSKSSSLHFRGELYFTVDSLEMKYRIGTLSKLGFPLKHLNMKHKIVLLNNVPVTVMNETEIRMHVPIIYSERSFKSKTKATDIELMKNRE